jgi:uncharacterized protein
MGFYSNTSIKEKNSTSVGIDMPSIMRMVYLWMTIGLVVCFGVAYFIGQAARQAVFAAIETGVRPSFFLFQPAFLIAMLIGYIILAFAVQPVIMRASIVVGAGMYLLYTVVFGVMTATVFVAYTQAQISTAFIATAGMFGAMSLYGYTTKADLSRLGSILGMALLGLVIASIVNWFAQSPAIYYFISYAGVVIFCGFVAYDTQWIKNTASEAAYSSDPTAGQRVALLGAFHLFYDFVQLFWFILRIMGSASRR